MALLLACGAAQATEWVSLGKPDNNQEIFVDVSSIRLGGAIRRAWIKGVYAPHTMKGGGKYANKWETETMSHFVFDCGEETVSIESGIAYFDDETSFSTTPGTAMATRPVAPDTVFSVEMRFICAWKPK
jgi:hypothetical protein